jgi:hypothetical protein
VAKPRTDAPAEDRAKELRKIADALTTLADRIEVEERSREASHPRRAMKARRQTRCYHAASSLLMDALALGGPDDARLRSILLSWRDEPTARWQCFQHVCLEWRPLVDSRIVPSTADLLACAEALRVIARGVCRTSG